MNVEYELDVRTHVSYVCICSVCKSFSHFSNATLLNDLVKTAYTHIAHTLHVTRKQNKNKKTTMQPRSSFPRPQFVCTQRNDLKL